MHSAFSEKAFNPEQSIASSFDQIATLYPSRIALLSPDWNPTYAELNATANRVAHKLLSHHGSSLDRVAVLMRHDVPLIAAVLGILKAARIAVVLNPTDPPIRLTQVLGDAEPALIITDSFNSAIADQIAGSGCEVVRFEDHSDEPADNPEIQINPEQTAILIYTSGSTGRPKGVMKTHRGIQHNAFRLAHGMELQFEDRVILLASLSGGQGVATTWCALLNGATLSPFPIMEKGVTGLADWITENYITVYISAASVFRHFIRSLNDKMYFPGVRVVRLGSETATASDFALWRKHFSSKCFLLHTLSSSETGNIAQQRFNHDQVIPEGPLSVGQTAPGMEVLLLDENGCEIRNGHLGEIVVRSAYMSPGYWRNETLTAERFGQSDEPGKPRTFRSGDLGRRDADGQIIFMGRKDARVKIRGYRIEISEIERVLGLQPEIEKAIIGLRESSNKDPQLAAYIVLRRGLTCTAEKLRNILRSTLPSQMVPTTFIFLDEFPLTPHGKVDREKLQDIEPQTSHHVEQPSTETEILLANIWRDVFHRSQIGRNDHFFDLGGDSLSAAVIAARIHAAIGVEMDLRIFTDHPTLADLAQVIDGVRRSDVAENLPAMRRVSRESPLPVSFVQERILRHLQVEDVPTGYTMARGYLIKGSLNVDIMRESMNYLLQRHEILRTTFDYINGTPVQIVHSIKTIPLPLIDLSGTSDVEKQVSDILRKESLQPFALKSGPLLRFILVRTSDDEYHLLRINHHIISDDWSWKMYFEELAEVYKSKLDGKPPPLPTFEPLQYGDFAAWERNILNPDGPIYKNEILWWKNLFAGNMPSMVLPFRRPRVLKTALPSDGRLHWDLDPETSQRLNQIGREQKVTYFVIRLAAFAALLSEKIGQSELAIGTYMTNRHHDQTQNLFGYFVNLAALRLHCDRDQVFTEWMNTVRKVVGETKAHSKISYEHLCDELRKLGINPPELPAILNVIARLPPTQLGDAELIRSTGGMTNMPWGFTIAFDHNDAVRRCRTNFDARIYDPVLVRAFMEQYVKLLDAVSRNPHLSIAALLETTKLCFEPKPSRSIFSKMLGKLRLQKPASAI